MRRDAHVRPARAYDPGVKRVDVLVVGAGPAGSSTAIHLARAGVRVLLAEKARFPRDKPCGGGLTGRALKRIPVDPSSVVERDDEQIASLQALQHSLAALVPGDGIAQRTAQAVEDRSL